VIGRTLGHYRIVEEIGKGGMGVVYRARDERLDRDVAVKILPAGTLADAAARQRFRKEALALSKLNHPNIQTVHDFDTQDGLDFLVAEYIPGVTLNDRLGGQGLPEKEVLRLGQQLAEGLAAAHEQGIIHRDLKPSNLRVTPDGRLKILDFGVAKLLGPASATATTETRTQTIAGTPLYMSPEQRRGERVDARSDLYAAGLVLWEMATGKAPAVAGQGLAGKASPELGRIVEKCVEEEPENRYQSAKELAVDIRRLAAPTVVPVAQPSGPRRWATPWRFAAVTAVLAVLLVGLVVGTNVGGLRERLFGAGAPKIDSLAVLPLKNLMGDPEQEYFVEGMHEALTAELSKISALKVISRTSTMRYKDTDKAMPQIARELGVEGLIEGSVLREGDQVRITVQLIHGPSDRHLWAQSFDRELRGILALHSDVARTIAGEIQVKLTGPEQARLAQARPVNPEAHDAYLRGRYYWNKRTEEGVLKALEYFQQSIERDPGYGLAYAGLADTYIVLSEYASLRPRDGVARAKAAAVKALEIDGGLAEAHTSLAMVVFQQEWDWSRAEREFQQALALNPSYATAHHWYALLLAALGRTEEARREIRAAQSLDPLSLIINANVGYMLFLSREYDLALEQYRKTLELDPTFPVARWYSARAYVKMGRFEEAIQELQTAERPMRILEPWLAYAYAVAAQRDQARATLARVVGRSEKVYVCPVYVALAYAALGEKDTAFVWLEMAYNERDVHLLIDMLGPDFDILRDDPRFQNLLRRMNFPE